MHEGGNLRSHNTDGVGLLDELLPRSQVNLTQRSTIRRCVDIVVMPKRLRVIADEMLGAGSNALALDAIHNGSTKVARQQGIFTQALKVATATRISVDVDGRPQHNLGMLELGLLGYLLPQALQELGVPCGR